MSGLADAPNGFAAGSGDAERRDLLECRPCGRCWPRRMGFGLSRAAAARSGIGKSAETFVDDAGTDL